VIAKKKKRKNMLVPQSICNELVVLGPGFRRKRNNHLLIYRRHGRPPIAVSRVSEPHVCSRACFAKGKPAVCGVLERQMNPGVPTPDPTTAHSQDDNLIPLQ